MATRENEVDGKVDHVRRSFQGLPLEYIRPSEAWVGGLRLEMVYGVVDEWTNEKARHTKNHSSDYTSTMTPTSPAALLHLMQRAKRARK